MFTRVSLTFWLLLVPLGACGGSSSETPFPLEPDLRREAIGGGPRREVVFSGRDRSDAGAEEAEPSDQERAPATWGEPRPSE
jgi:hypothetical protein